MIVVDASITLAWAHRDERTPAIDATFDRVAREGGIVPAIWTLEVANSLEMAVRRGRISPDQRSQLVTNFAKLALRIETLDPDNVWGPITNLAERHGLTAYDASYLELATRLQLPLATLDKALIGAALAEGVLVLP